MDENLNEELEDNIVTLKDDEGNDVDFEFLDVVEYEGNDYVVLLPIENENGDEGDEVVILKEDKDYVGDEDESSAICVRPNAAYPECVWSDGRDETYAMP